MIRLVTVASVLLSNTGPPPVIDIKNDSAASYWATRLKVSPEEIALAVAKVGPSVAAVRQYLGK